MRRHCAEISPGDVGNKPSRSSLGRIVEEREMLQTVTHKGSRKVVLQNLNHPGYARQVDAAMYEAMKQAFLKILPDAAPGLTVAELCAALPPHLPRELFPGGAKAGWYAKAVQLDLEAKCIITREKTRPLRLHRA